jgi:hypothetical protein
MGRSPGVRDRRAKGGAQLAEGVLHAGEGGIDGGALEAGDFLEGQAGIHAQPEDFALFEREGVDGGLDLAAEVASPASRAGERVAAGIVSPRGDAAVGEGGVEGAVGFFAPGLVNDQVVGDAEEPAGEIALTEEVHVLNGPDPGFLEPLVGLAGVGGEAVQEREERPLVSADQLAEGFGVAASPGCQECCIVCVH